MIFALSLYILKYNERYSASPIIILFWKVSCPAWLMKNSPNNLEQTSMKQNLLLKNLPKTILIVFILFTLLLSKALAQQAKTDSAKINPTATINIDT